MNITCIATHPAPVGARPRRRTGTAARLLASSLLALAATAASAQIITPPDDWVKRRAMPDDFISITAGNYHTCATRFNGKTYCWGRNDLGQSGVAGTKTCKGPGAGPGTACIDRPEYVMTATQVEAGAEHTCALDAGGAAFCWGNNHLGQLGHGPGIYGYMAQPLAVHGGLSFSSISGSHASTCGTTTGGLYCWGEIAGSAGSPTLVGAWGGYQGVSVGNLHACALFVQGSWRESGCWGSNRFGQLGGDPAQALGSSPVNPTFLGASVNRFAASNDYTCIDHASGVVQCFGYNGWGQLGNTFYTPTHVPQTVGGGMQLHGVATGINHACALDNTGRAHCWGNGKWGQLGNGLQEVLPSPQAVAGGLTFRAIAVGYLHTCAIGTDNHIYCWGRNYEGQLGTQFTNAQGSGGWVWNPVQALDP